MSKERACILIATFLICALCIFYVKGTSTKHVNQKSEVKNEKNEKINIVINQKQWNKYHNKYDGFKSKEDFINKGNKYIKKIEQLTGLYNWEKQYQKDGKPLRIDIQIDPNSMNHTIMSSHSIVFNANLFKYNVTPYAHELTHLIIGVHTNSSLSEGFACYISDLTGSNSGGYNYGEDIDMMSTPYIAKKKYQKIVDAIGIKSCPSPTTSGLDVRNTSRIYYKLSESFCKFLVTNYGMKKALGFYQSNCLPNQYKDVFGKTIKELKKEWITHLSNYPSQLTEKEEDQIINQYFSKHHFKYDS
ncbi:hypothetical protein lbkm_1106 [Lachnospiraceae bacterium KM106-2]|nr:hypothetical protein lbkm_1106 [Lachnospiraceae bacterium KM106-2]